MHTQPLCTREVLMTTTCNCAALMCSELRTDLRATSRVFIKDSRNNLYREKMGDMKHHSHGKQHIQHWAR